MEAIPILNIYYLLCYAWNRLEEANVVDVSSEDATSLLNLFARVLVSGTRHLLIRGLDRGYIDHKEGIRGVKGKIDFSSTIKRQLMVNSKLCCSFDELSYDVLHNQILKSTITKLANSANVDKDKREELADIDRRLRAINDLPLSATLFSRVQLHRNNAFYGFLMDVCEMIYNYYLVSEESGDSRFRDFIRDKDKMPKLFEEFVRNFYKTEINKNYDGYSVIGAEYIDWDASEKKGSDIAFLPKMLTDVSIKTPSEYLIIDTKFYKDIMAGRYDDKVRSDNLYQLFAYLKNITKRGESYRRCRGVLLYPTVKQDVDLRYEIQGHEIQIRTIDLSKPWRQIHRDLLKLVDIRMEAEKTCPF